MDLNMNTANKPHRRKTLERQSSLNGSPEKAPHIEDRSQSLPSKLPRIVSSPDDQQTTQSQPTPNTHPHALPQALSAAHPPIVMRHKASKDYTAGSNALSPPLTTSPLVSSQSGSLEQLSVISGMMPSSNAGRKRKHPIKPGKHICKYCGKGCAKPSVLEKHVRMHTGERPFPCDICGQSFKTKSNLYKHRKSQAHVAKLKEKGLPPDTSLDDSKDESMDTCDLDSDEESTYASYSRSGSFGSTSSFDQHNRRQDSSSGGADGANSVPVIPCKDKELYIDALRQLEAADDCIYRHAANADFHSKRCTYRLEDGCVFLTYNLIKEFSSSAAIDSESTPPGSRVKSSSSADVPVNALKSPNNSTNERAAQPAPISSSELPRRRLSRQSSVSSPANSMFSSSNQHPPPPPPAPSAANSLSRLSSLPEDGVMPNIDLESFERDLCNTIQAALPRPDGGDGSLIDVMQVTQSGNSVVIVIKLPQVPSYVSSECIAPRHQVSSIQADGKPQITPSCCPSCHSLFSKTFTMDIHQTYYCPQPKIEPMKPKEFMKAPTKPPFSPLTVQAGKDLLASSHGDRHKLKKSGSEEAYHHLNSLDLLDHQKSSYKRSISDRPGSLSADHSRSFSSQSSTDQNPADATTTKQHLKQHLLKNRSQGSVEPATTGTIVVISSPPQSSTYSSPSVSTAAATAGVSDWSTDGVKPLYIRKASGSPDVVMVGVSDSRNKSVINSIQIPQNLQPKSPFISGIVDKSVVSHTSRPVNTLPPKKKLLEMASSSSASRNSQSERSTESPASLLLTVPVIAPVSTVNSNNTSPINFSQAKADTVVTSGILPSIVSKRASMYTTPVQCRITTDGVKYMAGAAPVGSASPKSAAPAAVSAASDLSKNGQAALSKYPVFIYNDKYPTNSSFSSGSLKSLASSSSSDHPLDLKTSMPKIVSTVKHLTTPRHTVLPLPVVALNNEKRSSSPSSSSGSSKISAAMTVPSKTASQIISSLYLPTSNHPLTLHILGNKRPKPSMSHLNNVSLGGFNFDCKTYFCTLNDIKPSQSVSTSLFSNYARWTPCKPPSHPLTLDFKVPLTAYNSNRLFTGTPYKLARLINRSILTHSSYWKYKNKIRFMSDMPSQLSVSDGSGSTITATTVPTSMPSVTITVNPAPENMLPASSSANQQLTVKTDMSMEDDKSRLLKIPMTNDTRPSVINVDNTKKTLLRSQSTPTGESKEKVVAGGFKSDEDYVYVRGRGKGQYVCKQCGIRCKKPSMLEKHIRTHTDLRPYSCKHCKFSFKTKGNLTKHMKSKAHHRRCHELKIFPVPSTVDESQIDQDILANQQEISRLKKIPGKEGSEEEDDSDDEGMPYEDGAAMQSDSDDSSDEGHLQIDEDPETVEADSMAVPTSGLAPSSSAAALRRAQSMPAHHMVNSFDAESLDEAARLTHHPQPPPKKRKRNYLAHDRPADTSNPSRIEDGDAALMLLSLSKTPINPPAVSSAQLSAEDTGPSKIDHLIGALKATQNMEMNDSSSRDVKRISVVKSARTSFESQPTMEDDNDQPMDLSVNSKPPRLELKYICPLCRAICSTKESLESHMMNHNSTSAAASSTAEVGQHASTASKNLKKRKSSHMSLSFEEPPTQLHSPKIQTPNQLKRQFAVSVFNDSDGDGDDITHVSKLEPGEKPQDSYKSRTCQYCNKVFSTAVDVNTHIKAKHLITQEFLCTYKGCTQRFNNKNEFTYHLGTHALDDNKELQPITIPKCGICERTFKTAASLKQHSATHHGEIRSHICEYCDAGFTTKQALKHHLNTHTQERPYICGECGSTFARTDHLQQHMRTHKKDSSNSEPRLEATILSPSGHPAL